MRNIFRFTVFQRQRKLKSMGNNLNKYVRLLIGVFLFICALEGIKNAFRSLVDELNLGEEVHIMGIHDFEEEFLSLALFFQHPYS